MESRYLYSNVSIDSLWDEVVWFDNNIPAFNSTITHFSGIYAGGDFYALTII